jgi:hypothetical protein
MLVMIKKFKKVVKYILLICLVSTFFINTLYADPDPGLCPDPLNPFEFIDCGDADLPIDSQVWILMALTIGLSLYLFQSHKRLQAEKTRNKSFSP